MNIDERRLLSMYYFSPKQVANITKISTRTLHYYHEKQLLVPSIVESNGYRFYNEQDIHKLQTIQFLKELGLSLNQISEYFESDIACKNQILKNNYDNLIRKREKLSQIIHELDHHFNFNEGEEIRMESFRDQELQKQYQNEAKMKYGDTTYYQAFEAENKNQTIN